MRNQANHSEAAFLMRVEIFRGRGFGVLLNGAFGPIRRMDLVGPAVRGTPPPAGTTVVIACLRQEPLAARVIESGEAAAIERAIRAWDHVGVVHGFGPAIFRGGPGYLHGLYTDAQFGPRWNGTTLRWLEDFGSANPEAAADDLARRLAGWSQRRSVSIAHLEFGRPSAG